MMGPVHPPFGHFDLPTGNDNTNIQTWRLSGDSVAFSTTDSPVITTFDVESLQTQGTLTYPAGIGKILLSASHPHYLPGSSNSQLVNFVVDLIGLKEHEITVFKMGKDHKQIPFGKVTVPYVPYIHSFAVTAHHMLLFVYPLSFQEVCVLEFNPLIDCLHWLQQNASMFAFKFDGSPNSSPSMSIEMPSHFVMHHVNAYEDDQSFWVDTCAFDSAAPFTSKYVHANLDAMRNRSERNQVPAWPNYKSFRIDRSSGVVEATERELRDQDGFVYTIDFPFVNPNLDSRKHCKVWGVSAYAQNSSEYSDWAVVGVDVCSNATVNTKVWYSANQFPSEPIFVQRPGSDVEDDGVVLSLVLDGGNSTSYLLVLEPKSLKEMARAYLPLGQKTPYQQHGRWFDASDSSLLVI
jgi:carotenoid cleavage dioxygenase-like enzyme